MMTMILSMKMPLTTLMLMPMLTEESQDFSKEEYTQLDMLFTHIFRHVTHFIFPLSLAYFASDLLVS